MPRKKSVSSRKADSLDADEIVPGLWQGSFPPEGPTLRTQGFDVLVLCAEEYQPASDQFFGLRVIHVPFDDDFEDPPSSRTLQLIFRASWFLTSEIKKGRKALVTCWAGHNRSGLVSAMTLHHLLGMSGKQATQTIQKRRKGALSNPLFRELLAMMDGPPSRPTP